MEYDNTNRGALYENTYKNAPKQPDYTGKLNVNGKEMRLAAWKKMGKNGEFLSVQLSEVRETENRPEPDAPNFREQAAKPSPKANDDLPEWLQ